MNHCNLRKCWTILICVPLIGLFLFGLPSAVFSQSTPAHIYIEPAASNALTCGTHQIQVMVENVVDLTAYHLEISFDPDVVEVLEVVNGEFLAEPDDVDYFYEPSNDIDNVNGLISFGMAQQGVETEPEVEPQSGSGSLIVITLQALVPNASTIFHIDATMSNLVEWPSAFEIDFTTTDGLVQTRNCPPTANPQTVETVLNTPVAITLTGSDPDDDPLTYSLLGLPQHGTLSGGPLPDIIYTPYTGYTGTDTFTFRVFDGYDLSATATVTINIGMPGPEDILLSNDTILENQPVGTVVGVLSTVTEHPTATYTYALVTGDGDDDNESFEIVYNAGTGEYELRSRYVFDSSVKDTYTIRVRSTDTGDPELFVEQVFIITVLPETQVDFYYYLPLLFR